MTTVVEVIFSSFGKIKRNLRASVIGGGRPISLKNGGLIRKISYSHVPAFWRRCEGEGKLLKTHPSTLAKGD